MKEIGEPTRLRTLVSLADGRKSTRQIGESLARAEYAGGPSRPGDAAGLPGRRLAPRGKETFRQLTEQGSRFLDSTFGLVEEAEPAPRPAISKSEWKKLVKEIASVIDDPEEWLDRPNSQFEGPRPIDLIGTDDEVRVHIIIEALQRGFFS